jgi:hypothetical protein
MEDELLDNTELWFTGWLSQFIDEKIVLKEFVF